MRIYEEYTVAVRTDSDRFLSVQFGAVLPSQEARTATDGPTFCSSVQFSCGFFAVR
jgi:hypothetical protein